LKYLLVAQVVIFNKISQWVTHVQTAEWERCRTRQCEKFVKL